MIGSNNYLGLTHDPRVLEYAEQVARHYGTGCTGSRFLNGTLDLHLKLEHDLAEFIGKPEALVFSTGYQTNLGTIAALAGRDDFMIIDKLDHASIVDGCQMSAAKTLRFRHNDMEDLERVLNRIDPTGAIAVMVCSAGGHRPAPRSSNWPRSTAHLCDDAHLGVLGPPRRHAGTGVDKSTSRGHVLQVVRVDRRRHRRRAPRHRLPEASCPPDDLSAGCLYAVATVRSAST